MTRPRSPTASVAPLVAQFVSLCDESGVTLAQIARKAGIDSNILYRWNLGANPSLYLFLAAVNALGYELKIVEKSHDSA